MTSSHSKGPDDAGLESAVPVLQAYIALLETNYLAVPSDLNSDAAALETEYPHKVVLAIKNDKYMRTILGVKGVNARAFKDIPGVALAVNRKKNILTLRGKTNDAVESAESMLDTIALKAGLSGIGALAHKKP